MGASLEVALSKGLGGVRMNPSLSHCREEYIAED